jgi:hypothetical protein
LNAQRLENLPTIFGVPSSLVERKTAVRYRLRGIELHDSHNRLVALARGNSLYDVDGRRVATVRGNDLFDSDDRKMMSMRGLEVFDAQDIKIANLSDVQKSVDGSLAAMLLAALWFCFVR